MARFRLRTADSTASGSSAGAAAGSSSRSSSGRRRTHESSTTDAAEHCSSTGPDAAGAGDQQAAGGEAGPSTPPGTPKKKSRRWTRTPKGSSSKKGAAAAAAPSNTASSSTSMAPPHLLPESDFRQSLILPHLTRRFTLLRTDDGALVDADTMERHLMQQRRTGRLTGDEVDAVMAQYRLQSYYESSGSRPLGDSLMPPPVSTSSSSGALMPPLGLPFSYSDAGSSSADEHLAPSSFVSSRPHLTAPNGGATEPSTDSHAEPASPTDVTTNTNTTASSSVLSSPHPLAHLRRAAGGNPGAGSSLFGGRVEPIASELGKVKASASASSFFSQPPPRADSPAASSPTNSPVRAPSARSSPVRSYSSIKSNKSSLRLDHEPTDAAAASSDAQRASVASMQNLDDGMDDDHEDKLLSRPPAPERMSSEQLFRISRVLDDIESELRKTYKLSGGPYEDDESSDERGAESEVIAEVAQEQQQQQRNAPKQSDTQPMDPDMHRFSLASGSTGNEHGHSIDEGHNHDDDSDDNRHMHAYRFSAQARELEESFADLIGDVPTPALSQHEFRFDAHGDADDDDKDEGEHRFERHDSQEFMADIAAPLVISRDSERESTRTPVPPANKDEAGEQRDEDAAVADSSVESVLSVGSTPPSTHAHLAPPPGPAHLPTSNSDSFNTTEGGPFHLHYEATPAHAQHHKHDASPMPPSRLRSPESPSRRGVTTTSNSTAPSSSIFSSSLNLSSSTLNSIGSSFHDTGKTAADDESVLPFEQRSPSPLSQARQSFHDASFESGRSRGTQELLEELHESSHTPPEQRLEASDLFAIQQRLNDAAVTAAARPEAKSSDSADRLRSLLSRSASSRSPPPAQESVASAPSSPVRVASESRRTSAAAPSVVELEHGEEREEPAQASEPTRMSHNFMHIEDASVSSIDDLYDDDELDRRRDVLTSQFDDSMENPSVAVQRASVVESAREDPAAAANVSTTADAGDLTHGAPASSLVVPLDSSFETDQGTPALSESVSMTPQDSADSARILAHWQDQPQDREAATAEDGSLGAPLDLQKSPEPDMLHARPMPQRTSVMVRGQAWAATQALKSPGSATPGAAAARNRKRAKSIRGAAISSPQLVSGPINHIPAFDIENPHQEPESSEPKLRSKRSLKFRNMLKHTLGASGKLPLYNGDEVTPFVNQGLESPLPSASSTQANHQQEQQTTFVTPPTQNAETFETPDYSSTPTWSDGDLRTPSSIAQSTPMQGKPDEVDQELGTQRGLNRLVTRLRRPRKPSEGVVRSSSTSRSPEDRSRVSSVASAQPVDAGIGLGVVELPQVGRQPVTYSIRPTRRPVDSHTQESAQDEPRSASSSNNGHFSPPASADSHMSTADSVVSMKKLWQAAEELGLPMDKMQELMDATVGVKRESTSTPSGLRRSHTYDGESRALGEAARTEPLHRRGSSDIVVGGGSRRSMSDNVVVTRSTLRSIKENLSSAENSFDTSQNTEAPATAAPSPRPSLSVPSLSSPESKRISQRSVLAPSSGMSVRSSVGSVVYAGSVFDLYGGSDGDSSRANTPAVESKDEELPAAVPRPRQPQGRLDLDKVDVDDMDDNLLMRVIADLRRPDTIYSEANLTLHSRSSSLDSANLTAGDDDDQPPSFDPLAALLRKRSQAQRARAASVAPQRPPLLPTMSMYERDELRLQGLPNGIAPDDKGRFLVKPGTLQYAAENQPPPPTPPILPSHLQAQPMHFA